MTEVRIPTAGAIDAYVARPSGDGPWPGVVVIFDALGMTDDARRQAEWLASSGFIAVTPNLYAGRSKVACIVSTFRDLAARSGKAFDDIEATRTWLAARDDCTGRVGVIGFCMGGGFALVLAAGRGFSASSVNYGQVPGDAESLLADACPIVGSFGARDRTLRGAAGKLEAALVANGVSHDIEEYADAGHSFLNEHDSVLFTIMGKAMGGGYHEASAAAARHRITDFFTRHLAEVTASQQ